MKKINLFLIIMLCWQTTAFTQSVAINNDGSAPHNSAMLDVKSSTKGLLLPRTSTSSRLAIANPAKGLMLYDSNSNSFWFHNGAGWMESATGSPTNFWTLNGNNISNNNAGNVGIGINNPLAPLHIRRETEALRLEGNNSFISFYANGGTTLKAFLQQYNDNVYVGTAAPNATGLMQFYLNSSVVMTLKPTGDVGFGTTVAEGKLTVQSDINRYGLVHTDGTTTVGSWIGSFGGATGGWIGTKSNHPFHFFTAGGTPNMTIMPNGRVGIGTIDPLEKLVVNTVGASYGLLHTNGVVSVGTYTGGSINGGWFGTKSDHPLMFFTNGSGAQMVILQNGNVGVGTANPTYKLSVNGNIRSKEIVVETGWADYVFDDAYKLRPLDEVEQFIQQNKHLPNIPSAKEVEEKGLHLGDVQKRMMEKIEELSLYIIELHKRINALESKPKGKEQ